MRMGAWTFQIISDGEFRLDGGAMFGIIPRVLWQRQNPPDDDNRIALALHCLLAEGHGRRILVDTGIGDRWDARQREMYGMDRRPGQLLTALRERGIAPDSITDVILTHLHFDHAGGALLDYADRMEPSFPHATWWVQRQHWDWARSPSERDRGSFRPEDFLALADTGRLELVEGSREILPEIRVWPAAGHTPGMQIVEFHTEEGVLAFVADLIPFTANVHVPWVAAYDLNPLLSVSEKRQFLSRAVEGDYLLVLQHDPVHQACRVSFANGRFQVREILALEEATRT
jgi:glyoxylase-like metal-dependent hydrolase (beta-lactamase superfamily II)